MFDKIFKTRKKQKALQHLKELVKELEKRNNDYLCGSDHLVINGQCPQCKGKDLEFVSIRKEYFKDYLQSTLHCKNCGKYCFDYEKWSANKKPDLCDHKNTFPELIMVKNYPSTFNVDNIFAAFCVDCGSFLLRCKWLKTKIDELYPHFWKNTEIPLRFDIKPCKHCLGEDSFNAYEESSHSSIRAFEIAKKKAPEVYNFFLGSEYPEHIRIRDKIHEIDFSSYRQRAAFNPSNLFDLKTERNLLYDRITEFDKKLNQYGKEAKNEFRRKFGLPCIGEGWISETRLFKLVQNLFKDETVLFHTRPKWLDGLEIDIYLPKRRIAIEYMGKQHYEPVDFFGGLESFQRVQDRDRKKIEICKENNVKLILFDYRTEIKEQNLREYFINK